MASGFPGSIDNFTDPLTTSALNSPSHAGQHQDLNDAVEKIETYMGLVKVIPTSVSSAGGTAATLAANGTVNVGTSNTSLVVNGAFSALYDTYMIVYTNVNGSSPGADFRFNFDDGSSLYNFGTSYLNYNSNTVIGYSSQTQQQIVVGFCGANNSMNGTIWVRQPNLAFRTTVTAQQNTDTYTFNGGGNQDATTQQTKFKLFPSTGTISGGQIRVYGLRN